MGGYWSSMEGSSAREYKRLRDELDGLPASLRNRNIFEVYVNLTDVKDKPELLALLTEQNLSYREITTKPEVVLVVVAAKQLGTLQDIAVPATFQFLFLENS